MHTDSVTTPTIASNAKHLKPILLYKCMYEPPTGFSLGHTVAK